MIYLKKKLFNVEMKMILLELFDSRCTCLTKRKSEITADGGSCQMSVSESESTVGFFRSLWVHNSFLSFFQQRYPFIGANLRTSFSFHSSRNNCDLDVLALTHTDNTQAYSLTHTDTDTHRDTHTNTNTIIFVM